ncbi:MAG: cyclase family protein [Acidimicrobiaceae bacterium]|nr:cyclase family protein [Acidimicrobiaceae bacterium]
MAMQLPRYEELPIDPKAPAGSSWGVFGSDDQVGSINLLTESRVKAACGLVHNGRVFSLNWDLELPDPPLAGRGAMRHTIHRGPIGTDDHYDNFFTQRSSQWDALSHVQHPLYGFYNGRTMDEITGAKGSKNGMDNWARRGIAGRFTLLDIDRFRAEDGRPLDQKRAEALTVEDLEGAVRRQGSPIEEGDVLLLRFGWMSWYEQADRSDREWAALPPEEIGTPGLAHEEDVAAWLWDQHVAAVATDSPALEVLPVDQTSAESFLHIRLIPMLGIAIGEMFDLEALADDCASDHRYHGLFTAAPLNKVGGSGSPANALAIK